MLSKEDNEFITRIGPATAMGELLRRFWLPAVLSEELPGPDCVPVRFTLLGEQLVAIRDSSGRVGIFDAFCPHRGAPLFFGRNEDDGLRCVYHGWKFDTSGNCVDMPNVREGEEFKKRVNMLHYASFEGGRMVWVYMGPKDRVPPQPGFEWLTYPDDHVYVTKYFLECNYLQTLENEWAEGHSSFLHGGLRNGQLHPNIRLRDEAVIFETDYGAVTGAPGKDAWGKPVEEGKYSLGSHWILPLFSSAGAVSAPGTQPLNLKIPVDDSHTVFFRVKWSHDPIKPEVIYDYLHGNHEFPTQIPNAYVTRRNKTNDYEIDRNLQRSHNYTGVDPYPVQDFMVVENQRGAINDRTRETAVSSDRYIIYARRRLIRMAKELMEGKEPEEPWRPEAYRGIANFKQISMDEEGYRAIRQPQAIAVEAP